MRKHSPQPLKTPSILAIIKEGSGDTRAFNKDLDQIYIYLYKNNLASFISGPAQGIFYSKTPGKYLAVVPIKETVSVDPNLFQIKRLPSAKMVVAIHKGDSKKIDETFNTIFRWIKKHKLKWYFPVREIYHTEDTIEIQVPVEEWNISL